MLASVRHPESLLFYEEPDTVPPSPGSNPCPRGGGDLAAMGRGGWLLAPACRAGAAQAAAGPGRGGRAVRPCCSTWARQVHCGQRVPCPARCCPPPPTPPAAQPLNHITSRVVGLGLINIHSCFQV